MYTFLDPYQYQLFVVCEVLKPKKKDFLESILFIFHVFFGKIKESTENNFW